MNNSSITSISLLSVIVPAYKEERTILNSLKILVTELCQLDIPFEVIVICDGYEDKTFLEATKYGDPIKVIGYETNMGKGYAVRRGISECKGDIIVFIDADMEIKPSGIGQLLNLMTETGADSVIGSKRHPSSHVNYPFFRKMQSILLQKIIKIFFSLNLKDTQTGLKIFRGSLLKEILPTLTIDGFAFDIEILLMIQKFGGSIIEGPIQLSYNYESSTALRSSIIVAIDVLKLFFRFKFHKIDP